MPIGQSRAPLNPHQKSFSLQLMAINPETPKMIDCRDDGIFSPKSDIHITPLSPGLRDVGRVKKTVRASGG